MLEMGLDNVRLAELLLPLSAEICCYDHDHHKVLRCDPLRGSEHPTQGGIRVGLVNKWIKLKYV